MPNWNLSEGVKSTIRHNVAQACERTMDYRCADFPLTVDQVQRIVLDPELRLKMEELVASGIKTIEMHNQIRIAFLKEKLPGMQRSAVFMFQLPRRIFVGQATQFHISTTKFRLDEGHYLIPDLDTLSQETRTQLIKWIARCVRQRRLADVTRFAVNEVLDQHAKTVAHLLALWPSLATMSTGNRHWRNGRWDDDTTWRDRFRDNVKYPNHYKASYEVRQKYAEMIRAADVVLVEGEILQPLKHKPDDIIPQLEHFERLVTDVKLA
jgi:hypothetical protein